MGNEEDRFREGYITLKWKRYGYPAYVIDKLLELGMGTSEEGVLEQMIQEWLHQNRERLSELGITVQGARAEGYIQAKNPRPLRLIE